MINIRKGCFETNSSSTHSICISKLKDYKIPSALYFELGEFGWQSRVYFGARDLASYLYTALWELYSDTDIVQYEKYKNHIYEVLGKHDCEAVFCEPTPNSFGWVDGYIDHCYNLRDWVDRLMNSEATLMRYLFSPESFILTGNDNDGGYIHIRETMNFENVEEFYKGG